MDKLEIRKRAVALYSDELQYAVARDDEIDLQRARSRAAIRLGRELEGQDISGVWLGYVEGIARPCERAFEIDVANGQLRVDGTLRVRDLVFVPAAKARERDWLAFLERHSQKVKEHIAKDTQVQAFGRGVIDRMRVHGGDPTTIEACPDLFARSEDKAA